jgi:hypothetical protein
MVKMTKKIRRHIKIISIKPLKNVTMQKIYPIFNRKIFINKGFTYMFNSQNDLTEETRSERMQDFEPCFVSACRFDAIRHIKEALDFYALSNQTVKYVSED